MAQTTLRLQTTRRSAAETTPAQTATPYQPTALERLKTAPVLEQRSDCCSSW